MGLQEILERIQAAGRAQVQQVITQAEQEAQAVLARAQDEASQLYDEAYRQALEPAVSECARIRNQAHFEAVCVVGQACQRFVEATLAQVIQQMPNLRSCPEYPAAFRGILWEMLPGQDGLHKIEDRLILEADRRDQDLLESILGELGIKFRVEYPLTCWGGLNARSPDGTVRLLNTFESRLERILPYVRQQLAVWLESERDKVADDLPCEKEGSV